MAETEHTTNRDPGEPAERLIRALARVETLFQHCPSLILARVRAQLRAALGRCERGELGAGEAGAIACLARLTLEALAGGR